MAHCGLLGNAEGGKSSCRLLATSNLVGKTALVEQKNICCGCSRHRMYFSLLVLRGLRLGTKFAINAVRQGLPAECCPHLSLPCFLLNE